MPIKNIVGKKVGDDVYISKVQSQERWWFSGKRWIVDQEVVGLNTARAEIYFCRELAQPFDKK